MIRDHNDSGDYMYSLGHNQFSDLLSEEFQYLHLNGYDHNPRLLNMFRGRVFWPDETYGDASTDSVDWRAHGIVGAVRDQGHCGSCWAHAAVETVESLWAQQSGRLPTLSVQELVSCDEADSGCNGGLPDNAYTYIRRHGVVRELDFPY